MEGGREPRADGQAGAGGAVSEQHDFPDLRQAWEKLAEEDP